MTDYYQYGVYIVILCVGIFLYWKYSRESKGVSGGGKFSKGGSALQLFTIDLTAQAREGKIDPLIGRAEEIERMVQILSRRMKNNPLLLGSAGVGKTAIVEGLALRIVTGDIPPVLMDKKVLKLNLADMIAGTKYRGEFEDRVKKLVDEIVAERRHIILFIDEIHSLIQTKGTEGAMNLSDIIKPALSRGDLQAIGATTFDEYKEYIKPDSALDRRFQTVDVSEPTVEQTVKILQGIKKEYEEHHHVEFDDQAIVSAVKLSAKYIKERKLPDKAIDLMDEAGALVNIGFYHLPDSALKLIRAAADDVHKQIKKAPRKLRRLLKDLEKVKRKMDKTEDEKEKQDFKKEILDLTRDIEHLEVNYKLAKTEKKRPHVKAQDVRQVLASWLSKPVSKVK